MDEGGGGAEKVMNEFTDVMKRVAGRWESGRVGDCRGKGEESGLMIVK